MSAITPTVKKQGKGQTVTDLKSYFVFEATAAKDDTITITGLTTINYCKICKLSDGSDVSNTVSGNVITITQNPFASALVVGMAVGVV